MECTFLYRILGLQVLLKVAVESTEVALSWVTSAVVVKLAPVAAAAIAIARFADPIK